MFITKMFSRAVRAVVLPSLALCALGATHAQSVGPQLSFKTLNDFEICQRQSYAGETCLLAMEAFVRANPRAAMEAGKIARLNYKSYAALRFFEIAAKQKRSDICQDEDVQLAVVSGLALPGDYPDAKRARTLFVDQCFTQQVAVVVKEVGSESGDSYLKRNVCPILEKHRQAPPSCQPVAVAEVPAQTSTSEKLPQLDKNTITLGYVKVYSGQEGERVTMAPIKDTKLFLIRFDGVDSPWDGKVMLHQEANRGNDSADFWTDHGSARWNSLARRSGMLTVYVPGYKTQNGFAVHYAEKLSQESDAKALLKAYQP